MSAIRAAGGDIRVARYAASPDCAYAMFSGGGLSWFERQAKSGVYLLRAQPRNVARPLRPHLPLGPFAGQARPHPIRHRRPARRRSALRHAARRIVAFVANSRGIGRPVTMESLQPGPASQAIGFEALTVRTTGVSRWAARLRPPVSMRSACSPTRRG